MARFISPRIPKSPICGRPSWPAGAGRPPIHVMIQTDGEEPGSGASKAVKSIIDKLDDHVLAASEFLLDHYSYEQCKKHGYEDDQLLAEETAEAMAGKAALRALWLFDEDGEATNYGSRCPGTRSIPTTWSSRTASRWPVRSMTELRD